MHDSRALLRFAPFRSLTHPFFPTFVERSVQRCRCRTGWIQSLEKLDSPLPFHPRSYSIQIMPISDDLNKRLQFARMPARNVNYITRGAPARNVSFHGSVECDVLSVAGETRDSSRGGKGKKDFLGKMRSEIRV